MKYRLFSLIALISAFYCSRCIAQQKPKAATHSPYEVIVFEDDFSKDVPGKLPKGWIYSDSASPMLFVKKEAKGYSLAIEQKIYGQSIEPDIDISHADQLEISFDFLLEQNSDIILNLNSKDDNRTLKQYHAMWLKPGDKEHTLMLIDYSRANSIYGKRAIAPVDFAVGIWHHFSFYYNEGGAVKYFINNRKIRSDTDTSYHPEHCLVGLMGFARLTNFRLVAKKKDKSINSLLTESKLVSHAITFDVNSSVIKQEGLTYVKQLADLLTSNPSIKLEIDGHTDSDGDAGNNMRLSAARAEEVKKQLVANGIDISRLTAKGFGATQPIQPNTSPESKANNRRVEFIRH